MAAALQKEQIAQIYKDFGLDELTIQIYGKIQMDVINPVLNQLGISTISLEQFKKFPNQAGSKNKKLLQILQKGQIGIDAINQSIIRERPTYTIFNPKKKGSSEVVAHIVKIAKPIKTVKLKPQEAIDKSKEILEEQIAGGSVKEVTEFIKDEPDTEIFVMDENPLSVAPKNAWDEAEYIIQTEIPEIELEGVPFIMDSTNSAENMYQWQVGKPIYGEISEDDWVIVGYRPVTYKEVMKDVRDMLYGDDYENPNIDPESAEYDKLIEQRTLIEQNKSKFKEREARPSIPAQSREEQLHEKYGKPYIWKRAPFEEDWSSLTEEQITKIRKFRTSMYQGYKIKFGGDKQYLNYEEAQLYKLFDSGEGGQLSLSDIISSSSDDDDDIGFQGFNVDITSSESEVDEDEPAPEDKPVPVKKEKVKKEKVKKPKTPMLIQGQLFNIFSESESSESEDEALPQSVPVAPPSPIYKGPSKEEQLEQYLDNPGNMDPDDNIKLSDFSPIAEIEPFIPEDKVITNESELIDFKIYPDKPDSSDSDDEEGFEGFNIESSGESDAEAQDEDEPAPEVEQIVLTKPTIIEEETITSEIIVTEDTSQVNPAEDTSSEDEEFAFGDASTFKFLEDDDSSDLSSLVSDTSSEDEENVMFSNVMTTTEDILVLDSEIIVNEVLEPPPPQPADQSGVDDDSSDLSSLVSDSSSLVSDPSSEEEGGFTGFDIGGDTDTSSEEELDKIVNEVEKTLPKPFL